MKKSVKMINLYTHPTIIKITQKTVFQIASNNLIVLFYAYFIFPLIKVNECAGNE